MDVFNQRLEQEFDASVIPTAPNVPFKGKLLSLKPAPKAGLKMIKILV
jgi:translation elongation factor EF-4